MPVGSLSPKLVSASQDLQRQALCGAIVREQPEVLQ